MENAVKNIDANNIKLELLKIISSHNPSNDPLIGALQSRTVLNQAAKNLKIHDKEQEQILLTVFNV